MGEKKEYRSAVRSRRMIRKAFLDLLREKAFEKITVTDIVKRADINRSTFYAHYPDVRGLVEELMGESVDASIQLVTRIDFRDLFLDPTPFLQGLTAIGEENIELYKLLSQSDFALRQTEIMKATLIERAITTVDIPEHIRNSSIFHIHTHFFVGGILSIYQQWLQGKLDCSTQEIMDQVGRLITGNRELYLSWYESA